MLHREHDPQKPHSLFISFGVSRLFDDGDTPIDNPEGSGYTDAMNQALRDAREKAGMTQEELAGAIGCDVGSVYNWERRGVMPMKPYLSKIKEVLGIDLKEAANEDSKKCPGPGI